ncbi:AglZ/HisF2 family acetamidino modification protein [Flavobacterium collinsii]|jgi:cyclase|uniref:AglZ/HisF2 family acetamidino modification protein n=1 Tax=Flavobacterium TaxID=237 RepID=UPI0022C92922|nr:AglZ/HisF2 family acetamidino modification protein [Flavobacterium collinsii]GIQ58593.1 putative imidazole glycerol phosphate synthase subunit hisF2 [Flavobacterium collinsii]
MKRVIPVLLIKDGGLVKSIKFKNHKYVGDPINAVKIFNEKEVDEIVILDISASKEKKAPNIKMITEIAGEAFMPLSYGGGISSIEEVKNILYQGVEKVIFNSSAINKPNLITETATRFGSSSTVVSIDVKKNIWGQYKVFGLNGQKNTGIDVVEFAKNMENMGAGEIFLNSIDRDGTFSGYDIPLIKTISDKVTIPVIACGGAKSEVDLAQAINEGNASGVAAGSMFVFQGIHRAVLISYPNWKEIQSQFNK